MDTNSINNEVINIQSTLSSPFRLQDLTEINKKNCEPEIFSSYENYQGSVFRSLSANFDNNTNISVVNEAYNSLEKCFIENNILTKQGICKFKASASSKLLLDYPDIEDAFADIGFSESVNKRVYSNQTAKKIDLKRFKDNIFPFKFCDFSNSDNDSQSNTEENEDLESIFGSFVSENEFSEPEIFENESPLVSTNYDSLVESSCVGLRHINIENEVEESINQTQLSNASGGLLKNTVRDVRVVVEKLPEDITDVSFIDNYDNSSIFATEPQGRSSGKERRQVARKKTGGMVSNSVDYDDDTLTNEQKIIQQLSSKDGDFIPNVFDKMTRAGKRDLERVLAESTANLVIKKTSQLITEKIKELRPSDQSDGSSSEDEPEESDIHKTAEIVTNTIIEFLTKNKCKKLEKLGKDISSEICNKLNSLKFSSDIVSTDVLQPALIETSKEAIPALENERKIENKTDGEILGDATSTNSVSQANVKINAGSFQNAKVLEELSKTESGIHGSLENTADLIEKDNDTDEPRRPETRQSKLRNEENAKNALEMVAPKITVKQSELRNEENAKNALEMVAPKVTVKQSELRNEENEKTTLEMIAPKVTVKRSAKSRRRIFSKSRKRKNPSRQARNNSSEAEKLSEKNSPLIDGQFLIDSEINEESTFCVSNSTLEEVLKSEELTSNASLAGGEILKATADSTTPEISSINKKTNTEEINAGEVEISKDSTTSTCGETSSASAVKNARVKSSPEENSICHSSQDDKNFIPLIDHLDSSGQSNQYNVNADDAESPKVENDIKENSTLNVDKNTNEPKENKENINQNKISIISNTTDESKPLKEKVYFEQPQIDQGTTFDRALVSTSCSVPSEVLNDIITSIEHEIKNASDKSTSQKICEVAVDERTETLAASFLDYSLNDSCRLIVDESILKIETQSCKNSTERTRDIGSKKQDDQSNSELVALKSLPTEEKTQAGSNSDKTNVSTLSEGVGKEEHLKQGKDFKNEVKKDKPDDCFKIEKSIVEKAGSAAKQLTNEEKIARITNRDPRLINDKKIVNVMMRDPRIRNKISKVEESKLPLINQPETDVHPRIHNKISKVEEPKPQLKQEPKPQLKQPETDPKKVLDPKNSDPKKVLDNTKTSDPEPDSSTKQPLLNTDQINNEKKLSQHSVKTSELADNEFTKKKKNKKNIDEELLYKTPLSDLHESSADRPKYERNVKQKRVAQTRKDKDVSEDNRNIVQRRLPSLFDVNNKPIGGYSEFREDEKSERYYHQGPSGNDRTSRFSKNEEIIRRPEEQFYGGNYEKRDLHPVRQQDYQSSSRQSNEAEGYARRTPITERREFQDNQFYSRREFYRRNRYAHDHDHFGSSRSYTEVREETPYYSQQDHFDNSAFRISSNHSAPLLPDPVYEPKEDFDQAFRFSPPLSDLYPAPPPPLIRSPTPERLRREGYCPSPPRIGRDSPDDRDYEEFNRAFHRDYEKDERSFRGRNNFIRDKRLHRARNNRNARGNRDYGRNDESPPRKKFVTEHYYDHEDDYRGRWRSPSRSPDRTRRWSRDRSMSPPDPPSWDRPLSPPEPPPWDSPPSPISPPRQVDNFRDRTQSFKND